MSELDTGIEQETIPFYQTKSDKDFKTLKIKYTISNLAHLFKQNNFLLILNYIINLRLNKNY